jgi:hypothetical protein
MRRERMWRRFVRHLPVLSVITAACVLVCSCRSREPARSQAGRAEVGAVVEAIVRAHRPPGTVIHLVVDPRVTRPSDRNLEVAGAPETWTQANLGLTGGSVTIGDTARFAGCPFREAVCLGRPGDVVLSLSYPVVRGDSAYVEVRTALVAAPPDEEGLVSPARFERSLYVLARDGATWKIARRRGYEAA